MPREDNDAGGPLLARPRLHPAAFRCLAALLIPKCDDCVKRRANLYSIVGRWLLWHSTPTRGRAGWAPTRQRADSLLYRRGEPGDAAPYLRFISR